MSTAAALAEARVLKGFMQRHGVACSIELVEGTRKPEQWLNPVGRFRVEMSHHIVSRRSQGLTPFLHLVKVGRPDVKGPLCNGYGGFDLVYRIITMGVANHSGRGGPMTIDGVTIARDVAAYFAWGTEYEGGLDDADWPPAYRRFMAAANAAVLDYLRFRNGRTTDAAHCEHSTWAPGRKSDRRGYSRNRGIAEIGAHRAGHTGYSEEYVRELQTLLNEVVGTDLEVDGRLGPITIAAVEGFQARTGLVVDGDPGPITMAALKFAAKEDDMPKFIKAGGGNRVYVTDGVTKRHVDGPTALRAEQALWGTNAIEEVSEGVLAAIPDAPTAASVAAAVGAVPGVDAEKVAQAVAAALLGDIAVTGTVRVDQQ